MEALNEFFEKYLQISRLPSIRVTDVLEVLILAFLLYRILRWIKETKAWVPVRGIVVLAFFILVIPAHKEPSALQAYNTRSLSRKLHRKYSFADFPCVPFIF